MIEKLQTQCGRQVSNKFQTHSKTQGVEQNKRNSNPTCVVIQPITAKNTNLLLNPCFYVGLTTTLGHRVKTYLAGYLPPRPHPHKGGISEFASFQFYYIFNMFCFKWLSKQIIVNFNCFIIFKMFFDYL